MPAKVFEGKMTMEEAQDFLQEFIDSISVAGWDAPVSLDAILLPEDNEILCRRRALSYEKPWVSGVAGGRNSWIQRHLEHTARTAANGA